MEIQVGRILKNKLSTGQVVIVRVMALNVAGTAMPRVCDARETLTDVQLISANMTWACPVENLLEDSETLALEANFRRESSQALSLFLRNDG